MEFWKNLFNTSDFPARWHCGRWTDGHGWLHILSDLGVWSAYFAIPCILAYFALQRKDLPFRRIFLLFVSFILLCGTTHLMEAAIFWWPAYRLAGVVKLLTAVVSWVTVLALVQVAPKAMAMRAPEELEREIAARQLAESDLQRANLELERRVQERTAELAAANDALEGEREWFRTTLASIGEGVITTDTDGRVTLLNPVAQSLTGWTEDEAAGQPLTTVFDIVHEDTREPVENPALRALSEGTIVGLANHTILIAKDGAERNIDDSAAPIKDRKGNIVGAVLAFRDVSERRRAARERADAVARTESVLNHVVDGIVTIDEHGIIESFNPAAEGLFGYRANEVIGHNVKLLMPEPDHSQHDGYLLSYNRTGEAKIIGKGREVAGRRKDGSTFPMSLAVSEFTLGRRRYFTGIVRDITERIRVENELRQIAAQLSDAHHRKDEFIATLAHELRNPLAPIRSGLEVMKMVQDDPATMEEVRSTMERQTQQLTTLVDDLLDVSRISRGKLELRKCRVMLADVVRSAVEATKPLVDEAGHELVIALPERDVYLHADPHRLAQVLSNLLNNSVKYTPRGGHISVLAERQGSDVVITVKDDGIGIPADMLEIVFEMFSQIEHPLEKNFTGLGIGLTLVKSLVEMHGGRVEVRSDGPNQGSEFSVRLPVLVEMPVEETQPAEADEGILLSQNRLRVLVVDDNKAAADMLSMLVKMLGHEVRKANDGRQATEVAAEFLPDVVLMDIGMPKMNGYEAAEHIRRQSWGETMTLVALTGWGQEGDKQRTKQAGFDLHLTKPAEPAELQRLLAAVGQRAC